MSDTTIRIPLTGRDWLQLEHYRLESAVGLTKSANAGADFAHGSGEFLSVSGSCA